MPAVPGSRCEGRSNRSFPRALPPLPAWLLLLCVILIKTGNEILPVRLHHGRYYLGERADMGQSKGDAGRPARKVNATFLGLR